MDSHLALWWQIGDQRAVALQHTVESSDEVMVSQASLWEFAIKASLGKLNVDLRAFAGEVERLGFRWLPITSEHVFAVADLPFIDGHHDPFDRMLVAQAVSESLMFLTADRRLGPYGDLVRVV